ncbi:MAG: hypothetical protein HBSAPP03_23640 [Phycisphaerae bacterium]|nr:MAG: hypothetical protein HBSAPP03_23640 [Phycisphaerae bacterium]
MTPVRLGVVGLGFIGQTHLRAIAAAKSAGLPVELVAVADARPDLLTGRLAAVGNLDLNGQNDALFDPTVTRTFTHPGDLFALSDLDAVVIATPTDTHEPLAAAALRDGKHVLLEKPVALDVATIRRLAAAEANSGRRLVPAMVMRHWPGWPFLADCIRDHRYGPLHALRLSRLGARPAWSPFYADPARCGGALADLHIHDADFILHALGRPTHALSLGHLDHVTTAYRFSAATTAPIVLAEGAWLPSQGRGFRMRYVAEFASATVEFDLAASPTVRILRDDRVEHPEIPLIDGFTPQMHHFIECVAAWKRGLPGPSAASLRDAVDVTMLLNAERASLSSGSWESVLSGGDSHV